MNKMIFYTFVPFDETKLNRAYNVRIYYLKKAFENLGYKVYFIDGFYEDRIKKIKEIWKLIEKGEKINFVYGELPNLPFLLTSKNRIPIIFNNYDIKFIKFLKNKKIKIGLFIRDLHHLTSALDSLNLFKKEVYKFFFNLSINYLKNFVDIFFGPSNVFLEMFSFFYKVNKQNLIELMPGLILNNINPNNIEYFYYENMLNLIYVGGIYDNIELFKCFQDLHINNVNNVFLYFITRLNEIKINYKVFFSIPLIKILEANKKDLINYYRLSDISSLFFKSFVLKEIKGYQFFNNDYLSLAVPVKFLEYLENFKPVITYKEAFVSRIVQEYDIGWVIDYNYLALKELLLYLLNNKQEIINKRKNILKIVNNYSWENVAKKIIDNLKYL
ncbi:MAG: hypothetical protein N2485_05480 [bacterium]|nr:hypothetical protein [bacterium]